MANSVTINISNNCGCCGSGGSGGSGSGQDIFDGVMEGGILDPEIEGPPKGFIDPPIPISDRQCKMATWIYTWVEGIFDTFANSTTGDVLLTIIANIPAGPLYALILSVVTPVVAAAVTFVLAALGTPGVLDEVPLSILAGIVAYALTSVITNQTVVKNFTKPTATKILEQIQLGKDDIICALSKAGDPYEAKAEYEKVLTTLDLSITQRSIAIVFVPNQFINMLFYTAEWWPSFDENILSNISANCCGSFTDGNAITPGSTQACQAASFIIDKLIATFNTTNTFVENFFYLNLNPFNDDTAYLRTQVEEGLQIPSKIEEKAASYTYFVSMVASYMNATTITGGRVDHWGGTHFGDLATELQTNRATIHAALLVAADESAVFNALYDPLDTYITANIETEDPDLADYLRGSITALIAPPKSQIPSMMFTQDGATAFYARDECTPCQDDHTFPAALTAGWTISPDSEHSQLSFQQVSDYTEIALINNWTQDARLEVQIEIGDATTGIDITGELWKDGKSDGFRDQFFHKFRFQLRTQDGQLYNDGEFFAFWVNTDHDTSFQWIDVTPGAQIRNSGQPIQDPTNPIKALVLAITKSDDFKQDQEWTMRLRNLQISFLTECGRIF